MGFFDRILKQKDDDTREQLAEDYGGWFNVFYNNKKVKKKINAFSIPSFYRAVDLVGDIVSGLPLDIYQKTDGGRIKFTDNEWYDCFRYQANSQQSIRDFLKLSYTMRIYHGNCYWYIDRNIHTLTLLDPEKIEIDCKNGFVLYEYNIKNKRSDNPVFYADDIIHLKTMQTHWSSGKGLKIDDHFRLLLGQAIDQEVYQSNFVDSNAAIKGILSVDQSITDTAKLKAISQSFRNYMSEDSDGKTVHTPPVLSGGAKFQPINLSPQELALIEKKKDVVRDICNIIGVPANLVNQLDKTSYSSLEMSNMNFLVYSIQPLLDEIISEINTKIFTKNDRQNGIYPEFNTDSLLRIDSKTKTEILDKQIKNGILTVNEARQKLNLPAMAACDKPLIPVNMTYPESMQQQKDQQVLGMELKNEILKRQLIDNQEAKATAAQDKEQAATAEQAKMADQSVVDFNTTLMTRLIAFVADAHTATLAIDQITDEVLGRYNVTADKNLEEFKSTFIKGMTRRFETDENHSASYEICRYINALSRQCFVTMGVHDVKWSGGELDGVVKPMYLPFIEKSETQKFNVFHPPLNQDDCQSWLIPSSA